MQSDPLDHASPDGVQRAGDLDDLPDVPDEPSPPAPTGGDMMGDDDAIRQIRRRVSPLGWLLILAVVLVGGGTMYLMVVKAMVDAQEDDEGQRGRLELAAIVQRDLPRAQLAAQVRALYARSPSQDVKRRARRILAGLRDPESVSLLIEGLATPGAPRAEAALGLAEIGLPAGDPARAPLLEVLPRTDPTLDRVEVAWALVVLSEARAWPTVRELLESNKLQNVQGLDQRRLFDPALVARMAGRERLVELVSSRSVTSRRLAALSLGELASPDTFDALSVLARDADLDVAREAAIGLGKTGDPRAADSIMAFLNGHPDARDGVLAALATNSGAQGLAVVIHGARDLQTRATATRLLRELHDPDAGDALFEALGAASGADEVSAGMKRNAVFGLAEIGDARAVDGLITFAQHATTHLDPNSTQEAKLALEQIRRIPGAAARAKVALLALLRDPHGDFIRTPLLLALAAAGDPAVGSELMAFLGQPDAQEGAAVAVCALRHAAGIAQVRSQIRRPAGLNMAEETVRDEQVFIARRNALRGIAWSGDARIAADLMRIIDDREDRRMLREEAGFALAALADEATLNEVANRALDTNRPEDARLFYIWALRGRSTPAISTRLIEAYVKRGVSPDLMRAAAIAAGFGADESASERLMPLVTSTEPNLVDANVRFAAAVAIVLGGTARAANALLDALVGSDELAGTLQNEFAPRSNNPNAATQQENWLLLPLTAPMFDDGRVFRRIEAATILEQARAGKHFGWALTQLTNRLRSGWDSAVGIGPYQVRGRLRDAALGTDSYRQDQAFRALRALNDRGSLLALRRQHRVPAVAERARRELLEMSSGSN